MRVSQTPRLPQEKVSANSTWEASQFLACLEETSENSPGFQAREGVDMGTPVPEGRLKSLGCTGSPQILRCSHQFRADRIFCTAGEDALRTRSRGRSQCVSRASSPASSGTVPVPYDYRDAPISVAK